MATGGYVGNNNVARKIVGGYVGVNNLARKIIKGYVGVNGTASLMYDMSQKKGYSFDDFIEYCQLIKAHSTITDNKNAANWILNNKTTLQNYLNQLSDLNEYTTWYLYRLNASSTYNGNIGIIAQKKGTAWNWGGKIKSTPYTRLDYSFYG